MSFLFGRSRAAANRKIIGRLNEALVAAVRVPAFYGDGGVPDTLMGRFELLVLHTWILVRHMRMLPDPAPAAAQDLIDLVFRHLDFALREHGVGDIAVPKRMKRLAEGFLGRSAAYDAALKSGDRAELATALARNVYGGARQADDLARYVLASVASFGGRDLEDLFRTPPRFPDPSLFLVADFA